MPIKPENLARYPKNWKAIRAEVLERAGHKCEKCKAPDKELIARGAGDDLNTYMLQQAMYLTLRLDSILAALGCLTSALVTWSRSF